MNNILVVGKGEIGTAIGKLLEENKNNKVYYRDLAKDMYPPIDVKYDVMHFCIPEVDVGSFIGALYFNITCYNPVIVVIHTSISLETASLLENSKDKNIIFHVPVRGKHGNIIKDLKRYPIFIGTVCINKILKDEVKSYISSVFGTETTYFWGIKETALAKLLSVVWLGMEIMFVQQVKLLCEKEDIDFTEAYRKYFLTETTGIHVYDESKKRAIRYKEIERPVFYPSVIGGKCVIQDCELLNELRVCKEIIKTNKRFKLTHNEKK